MAERYRQFDARQSRHIPDAIAWTGVLCTNYGNSYLVEIVHAPAFPLTAPSVFVLYPRIRSGAPHRYADGSLCLHLEQWVPYRSTAAGIISATAEWLLLYDHWLATGERW